MGLARCGVEHDGDIPQSCYHLILCAASYGGVGCQCKWVVAHVDERFFGSSSLSDPFSRCLIARLAAIRKRREARHRGASPSSRIRGFSGDPLIIYLMSWTQKSLL